MKVIWCLLFALIFFTMGCDNDPAGHFKNTVAPATQDVRWAYNQLVRLEDGSLMVTNIIYSKEGTVIASYPNDFMGPIPCGYSRQNGTGANYCTAGAPYKILGAAGDNDGLVLKTKTLQGDPTVDDVRGDPDIGE
jgi:hypothetical protein